MVVVVVVVAVVVVVVVVALVVTVVLGIDVIGTVFLRCGVSGGSRGKVFSFSDAYCLLVTSEILASASCLFGGTRPLRLKKRHGPKPCKPKPPQRPVAKTNSTSTSRSKLNGLVQIGPRCLLFSEARAGTVASAISPVSDVFGTRSIFNKIIILF